MATEWFYTTNKQQMGPVSWNELRELAEVGILKPHDMVWSEGMDEWVKAINQGGLFADEDAAEAATTGKPSKKSSYSEAKPPPGRRTRPRHEDEDEDEEDDRDAKRKARQSAQDRTKMAMGLKIGLILAAVVFGLFLLVGCGGGLLWISLRGNNPPPPANNAPPAAGPRKESYTVRNLPDRKFDDRRYTFTQGKTVTITVRNNLMFPNTDVDLWILRGKDSAGPNERPIANDDRLPNEDPNCRVQFVVPATDTYRVRVINRGPGVANTCDVQIEER